MSQWFGWVVAGVTLAAAVLLISSRRARRFVFTLMLVVRARWLSWFDRLRGKGATHPARLRESFEKLGPTYVKLAQLVASSEGMFPEAYSLEFRHCLDRVPEFSIDEVNATIREELKHEPSEIFESIDTKPLASASIAQVHGAVLKDGRRVVVKVQRPGIQNTVAADLAVLRVLSGWLEKLPRADMAKPTAVVEDFAMNLAEELDFRREAANLDQFNEIMVKHAFDEVAAPKPVHEWSSQRVLVMERFEGVRIDDHAGLKLITDDVESKLLMGMNAWFRCLLVHGFFHGDVHAGNLMALRDGRIGFLDFGIVGRFEGERKKLSSDFLMAMAARDFEGLARTMIAMTGGNMDATQLAKDLEKTLEPLLDPSRATKYADLIPLMTRIGMRHEIPLPRDFILILKQMLYFDRYAKLLAPNLNIFTDERILSSLMQSMVMAQMENANPA